MGELTRLPGPIADASNDLRQAEREYEESVRRYFRKGTPIAWTVGGSYRQEGVVLTLRGKGPGIRLFVRNSRSGSQYDIDPLTNQPEPIQ